MNKIIGFSVLALFLGLIFACDALITPLRGRENPLDSASPVRNFNAFAIGPDSFRVVFDQAEWADEGKPRALWLFVRPGSAVATVEDAHDYRYWYWWENGQGWDGEHYFDASHILQNPDQNTLYYISAFWTYDDVSENDDGADWLGPVTDAVGFEENYLYVYPVEDGYFQLEYEAEIWEYSSYFNSGDLKVWRDPGAILGALVALRFDYTEFPAFFNEAGLRITSRSPINFGGNYYLSLLIQDWSSVNDNYDTMRQPEKRWDSKKGFNIDNTPENEDIYIDVLDQVEFWQQNKIAGGGLVIEMDENTDGTISLHSSEAGSLSVSPALVFLYYGSGD